MSDSKKKDIRTLNSAIKVGPNDEQSLMDEWLALSEQKAAEKSALHKMMSELKKQLKN